MNTGPASPENLFVVNPELDAGALVEAADLKLNQAEALLEVNCPGVDGHLDLGQFDAATAGTYMDAVHSLVSEARLLLQASFVDKGKEVRHA